MDSLSARARRAASRTLAALATAALSWPAASAMPAPALSPPSLCRAEETPLFACPIGHKLVSVCGNGGRAAYRFGRPGKVAMSSRALAIASRAFSGGGETQISFTNDGYTYVVFDRTVRTGFGASGTNAPDFASGLAVRKGGRTVRSSACGSDATIAAAARRMIPQGGFVEH